MKMRFKILCCFIAVILAGCVFASPPNNIFSVHKEKILSRDFSREGGWCFGVGYEVAVSDTSQSIKICTDKSILRATANLLTKASLDRIDWPESVGLETRIVLIEFLTESLTVKKRVKGLNTIYSQELPNGQIVSVVAVMESTVSNLTYTIDDVEKVVLNPEWLRKNFKRNPQPIYEFYLARKNIPVQLKGKDFNSWSSAELDLFCGVASDDGVKDRPIVSTNIVHMSEREELQGRKNESTNGKLDIHASENETIGF